LRTRYVPRICLHKLSKKKLFLFMNKYSTHPIGPSFTPTKFCIMNKNLPYCTGNPPPRNNENMRQFNCRRLAKVAIIQANALYYNSQFDRLTQQKNILAIFIPFIILGIYVCSGCGRFLTCPRCTSSPPTRRRWTMWTSVRTAPNYAVSAKTGSVFWNRNNQSRVFK